MQGGSIGLIDIFDLEPKDQRAALGILIVDEKDRGKGYGREVLDIICSYCFNHLGLHQVYANVTAGNIPSIHLFENHGFQKVGVKKEWILVKGKYKDEVLYQLINNVH